MLTVTVRIGVVAAALLLCGCSQLTKSIESRVEVSEQCRLATSISPFSRTDQFDIGTIYLGNVGTCDISSGETLLAMCSYKQIKAQYIDYAKEDRVALKAGVTRLETDARELEKKLRKLEQLLKAIDDRVSQSFEPLRGQAGSFQDRTAILQSYLASSKEVRAQLDAVKKAHFRLHASLQALNEALDAQARLELASWSLNLHAHLAKLEQLLSGDITMVLQANLRDQVMTHVGRRSLELLHGSLKPADTLLNKLDDRSHGALSVGYLAFYASLQEAFDTTYVKLKHIFGNRLPEHARPPGGADEGYLAKLPQRVKKHLAKEESAALVASRRAFLVEMRRAACDHMIDGTRFSMLTEMVDSMLVRKVSTDDEASPGSEGSKLASKADNRGGAPGQSSEPAQETPGKQAMAAGRAPLRSLFLPAVYALPTNQPAEGTPAGQGKPSEAQLAELAPLPANATTPLAVYVANEWAARHQVLRKQIGDKLAAHSASTKTPAFPALEGVDESLVTAIADAATAKSVDDAATRDPELLTSTDLKKVDLNRLMASSANLSSAATAVSVASAVLNANISVANVNTFNPSNYNHIAPVIQIAAAEKDALSLCSTWDPATGAACSTVGDGYVITFPQRSYDNDHCTSGSIVSALDATGRALAAYRDRHNMHFKASISGHASEPPAKLSKCPEARLPVEKLCSYANLHRDPVNVAGCAAGADGNMLLSVGRAKDAADRLERAGAGAVIVGGLAAAGTASAATHQGASRPADDQTVVVRLTRLLTK